MELLYVYNHVNEIYFVLASVNCGSRTARTCALCPTTNEYGHYENWCNGDCEWSTSTSSCIEQMI